MWLDEPSERRRFGPDEWRPRDLPRLFETQVACPHHEKIAREYALKITEVYDMAQLVAGYAIFGEAALEEGFTTSGPVEEVKAIIVEAREDSERLSDDTPLPEVLEILAATTIACRG